MAKTPPSRHRMRWSEDEDKWLTFYWGHHSLTWIARKLNRSEHAVAKRAVLLSLGPAARSTFSMRQLIEYLGVSESRIRHAAQACGLHFSKAKRSEVKQKQQVERYAIDVDAAYAIEEYLKAHPERLYPDQGSVTTKGKWNVGKKPPCCVVCGRDDRPHFAKGECTSCYQKRYKATKYYTRWLTQEDIDFLLEFADGPWTRKDFEEAIDVETRRCRVARGHTGDLRGYVIWNFNFAGGHILSVAVHPDHRQRGIAKALLEDVIVRTPRTISLEVRADNEAAIKLYVSLKFEYQGKYVAYYDDGVDALIYARIGLG